MSNSDLHNEPDLMSDARLDELLDLAKPNLDPARQKVLRRSVNQTLKSNRSSWWKLFRSDAPGSRRPAIRLLVVGGCLLMLIGVGWLATPNPNPNRTAPVAMGTSEPKSPLKPATNLESESAKPNPIVVSSSKANARSKRVVRHKANQQQTARKHNHHLYNSLAPLMEASLFSFAGTDSGLMLVDQFADDLDKATIDIAANRAALLNSLMSRSEKQKYFLELERRDEQLRFARRQLESYLADAVERLPMQQATSAFRILCRVGLEPSLPVFLKYRNIEATQLDTALAVGKLADAQLLTQLVLETNDVEIQSRLMAGLLCRHDPGSLDLFLELTAKHDLYSAAQKSGGIARCVPTGILLQRLQSNRASIARAAAITMSGMNDPIITEHLLQLANRPESSWSAVMALTARKDNSAIRFVQLASNDARWSATIINETRKWNRILVLN